jgi:hypothetical protein
MILVHSASPWVAWGSGLWPLISSNRVVHSPIKPHPSRGLGTPTPHVWMYLAGAPNVPHRRHVDGLQVFVGAELHLSAPSCTAKRTRDKTLIDPCLAALFLFAKYISLLCCEVGYCSNTVELLRIAWAPTHLHRKIYRDYETKLLSRLGQRKSGSRIKDLER